MPRRLRFLLACLFVALLGGQQAGYAHLYSHVGDTPGRGHVEATPSDSHDDLAHHPCLRCLALAALDAWTPGQPAAAPVLAPDIETFEHLARGVVPQLLHGGNSRAPPALS